MPPDHPESASHADFASHFDLAALRSDLQAALVRATALAEQAAMPGADALARRAASALYHVTSAIAMAWEGTQGAGPVRQALARRVLRHRLQVNDPLAADLDAQADEDTALILSR